MKEDQYVSGEARQLRRNSEEMNMKMRENLKSRLAN